MKLPWRYSLDSSPLIMAIVNCNEDSFYPPSRGLRDKALALALKAEEEGADIIDFGAESSRPGSRFISLEEEEERLLPVIRAFRERSALPLSVDTRKSSIARLALEEGADIINDISALTDDTDMGQICAQYGATVVLMHKKGEPQTMQENPSYDNLIEELGSYLGAAAERALALGIKQEQIILDPGLGFGKTTTHNIEIIRGLSKIRSLAKKGATDYPILIGHSRKRFIRELCGLSDAPGENHEALAGTLAVGAAAILGGASILRVHDVKAHVDLVTLWRSIGVKDGMVSAL
ncbi:MAG: dihydropteroate synthase [Treponema sp.]|nr:dihydropteroate synthase [Treponema sp.]